MALALYRKYRPAKFAEVVGQEHVTDPLRTALAAGRINHAYLFSGPRGCGKTSSARILARSLNCELGPTPDPCGACPSCRALAPEGPGSIDVVELDAASHGGVDDARELRDRAFYAPAESRYRVFIVDEAHMVTTQGFNALLKIVEEPPEHLVFVFATTEPDKVLPTIRSRTHHYPFRLIPPGTVRGLLERICAEEGVTVAPAVFPLVIRAGGGSARDTLSVLDQLLAGAGPEGVTYERAVALLGVTDVALIDDVVDALAAGDRSAVFETVDRLVEAGHDPRRFASDLLQRMRDVMLLQAVPEAVERGMVEAAEDELTRMAEQAERLGPATLARYGEILHTGLTEMRGATAPRMLLELMCARMLLPAASDSGLLERVERMERRIAIAPAPGPGEAAPAEAGPAERRFVRPSARAAAERTPGATAGDRAPEPGSGRARSAEHAGAPAPGSESRSAERGASPEAAAEPAEVPGRGPAGAGAPPAGVFDREHAARPTERGEVPGHGPVGAGASPAGASDQEHAARSAERPGTPVRESGATETRSAERPGSPAARPEPATPRSGERSGPPAAQPGPAAAPRSAERSASAAPLRGEAPAGRGEAPAASAPGYGRAPAAPGAPAPAVPALDAAAVRRVWPEILNAAKERKKRTGALLVSATVRAVEDDTLVLSIGTAPLARLLSEQSNVEVIVESLHAVLGVRWRVRCEHGQPAAAGAPPRGGPVSAPPSTPRAPSRQPGARPAPRRAADDGVPLPPEPPPEDAPPDDEESMIAEVAAEAAGAPVARRDPEEVAIELLSSQLGARTIDRP